MSKINRLPNLEKLTKPCVVCEGTGIVRKLDHRTEKQISVHCDWCAGTGFVRPALP